MEKIKLADLQKMTIVLTVSDKPSCTVLIIHYYLQCLASFSFGWNYQ